MSYTSCLIHLLSCTYIKCSLYRCPIQQNELLYSYYISQLNLIYKTTVYKITTENIYLVLAAYTDAAATHCNTLQHTATRCQTKWRQYSTLRVWDSQKSARYLFCCIEQLYIYIYICIYMCVYSIYMCVYIFTNLHTYIHIFIYIYTHIYLDIYMYTYKEYSAGFRKYSTSADEVH